MKEFSDFTLGNEDCNSQVFATCLQTAAPEWHRCAKASDCMPVGEKITEYGPYVDAYNKRINDQQTKMGYSASKIQLAE